MEFCANASWVERFDWLMDWLYPPRCRACAGRIHGRDAEYFCPACQQHIQLVTHPLCDRCGRPFPDAAGDDHTCGACLFRPPSFASARAWACYPREEIEEHPLRQVVYKFKYGRKVSLGKPLGRVMTLGCREFLEGRRFELIVPVPLHSRRLRWRGFNQSLLLAQQISRACQVAADPFVLRRARPTPPQTQLPEDERRRNVRGAFTLNPDRPINGKGILLVDDVYTSGATVNECSRVLMRGGAREVSVVTLARVV